jgi:transposase InsO family protein
MAAKGKRMMMLTAAANRVYYNPSHPASYSTLSKLSSALNARAKKKQVKLKAWLESQEAFTSHRPVRKRFQRNPYSVTNTMDVWECDLVDLQNISKFNDQYRYLLTVIDVFSKYLHAIPLKAKTGSAVAAAFKSIFNDPKYSKPIRRRPLWVRTDRGKEFLNSTFQTMLKQENIQFQLCRNPDIKCAVIERVHRTIRDKMYKYFTAKNTYRYLDVLPKFVKSYNGTVHSSIGMAPSRVRDSNVLAIWKRMQAKRSRIRVTLPKFHMGQHVRISRSKMLFAKGAERNYTVEIFRIIKVIRRKPRPVYELEDLNNTPIEGQFYGEELTPVRITKHTTYKIDKILGKRTRGGILEYHVSWVGYPATFNSWLPASSVKAIQ